MSPARWISDRGRTTARWSSLVSNFVWPKLHPHNAPITGYSRHCSSRRMDSMDVFLGLLAVAVGDEFVQKKMGWEEWVSGVNSVNKRTLGKGLKTSNHDFSKGSSKGLAARSVKSSIERGTAFGLQGKADKKRWWKVGAKNRRPFAMERCLLFNTVAYF